MSRTITVKGMGKVTAAPDLVVISMNLEAREKEYEKALALAAEKIEALNAALEKIGFEKKSVKTTDFNVRTVYDRVQDKNGYKNVFGGYACSHRLKVEFDFDTKRLAQTLSAISGCLAQPELSIAFTVKDPTAVSRKLLQSATKNAREKAQILCEAAGVTLGELLNIDYNWGEINVVSHTNYMIENRCMAMPMGGLADMELQPDDINVSDTATFVWEIK